MQLCRRRRWHRPNSIRKGVRTAIEDVWNILSLGSHFWSLGHAQHALEFSKSVVIVDTRFHLAAAELLLGHHRHDIRGTVCPLESSWRLVAELWQPALYKRCAKTCSFCRNPPSKWSWLLSELEIELIHVIPWASLRPIRRPELTFWIIWSPSSQRVHDYHVAIRNHRSDEVRCLITSHPPPPGPQLLGSDRAARPDTGILTVARNCDVAAAHRSRRPRGP